MPSPFPGMDPYLEHPRWFHGFHNNLITYTEEQLQPLLPAAYYATGGRRITVEDIEGDEHIETFVEIRGVWGGQNRLVASIEVVSRSNKTPSHPGFAKYRRKQRQILAGQAHLIEIDLLRAGTHVTAVPVGIARTKSGPFDYHVSAHRFDRPRDYLVYPIRLNQRLPVIAIPLLPEDPDVLLDLQAAFTRAYDTGPFHKAIRYCEDPIKPRLNPDQAEWVKTTLKAAGEGESPAPEPDNSQQTGETTEKKEGT